MNSQVYVHLKEYQNDDVKKTLNPDYVPEIILDARKKETQFLLELEWDSKTILDIGCGKGPHALLFAPHSKKYIAIDICKDMIAATQKNVSQANIANVECIQSDASELDFLSDKSVDRVISMYFTMGNIRKNNFDVANYSEEDITHNKKQIRVLTHMYRILESGSIYCTIYKQKELTRELQKDFYTRTGQHIITKDSDPFTATEEGFWSLRYTKDLFIQIASEAVIPEQNIHFHDMNEIAWIVEIQK